MSELQCGTEEPMVSGSNLNVLDDQLTASSNDYAQSAPAKARIDSTRAWLAAVEDYNSPTEPTFFIQVCKCRAN